MLSGRSLSVEKLFIILVYLKKNKLLPSVVTTAHVTTFLFTQASQTSTHHHVMFVLRPLTSFCCSNPDGWNRLFRINEWGESVRRCDKPAIWIEPFFVPEKCWGLKCLRAAWISSAARMRNLSVKLEADGKLGNCTESTRRSGGVKWEWHEVRAGLFVTGCVYTDTSVPLIIWIKTPHAATSIRTDRPDRIEMGFNREILGPNNRVNTWSASFW